MVEILSLKPNDVQKIKQMLKLLTIQFVIYFQNIMIISENKISYAASRHSV